MLSQQANNMLTYYSTPENKFWQTLCDLIDISIDIQL